MLLTKPRGGKGRPVMHSEYQPIKTSVGDLRFGVHNEYVLVHDTAMNRSWVKIVQVYESIGDANQLLPDQHRLTDDR